MPNIINLIFFSVTLMDIGELLSFKPVATPKRPADPDHRQARGHEDDRDDPNESYDRRAAKRRKKLEQLQKLEEERLAALEAEASALAAEAANGSGDGGELQVVAESEDQASGVLDEARLKRMVLNFEKKVTKNQELRIKFPDEPAKFLESEMELYDSVQELRAVAAAPELYPALVDLQCVPSILGLLSHENTDLAVAAVDLLQELTDLDNSSDETGPEALVGALVAHQAPALLVQNLERLDETVREESDGVHSTLAVVENLIEHQPESICSEAAGAGLLTWLTRKLKVKVPFDPNKLYASEILSILLQSAPENRSAFVASGAAAAASAPLDSILQQLAYYKRHDPNSAEEQEMMENLFDCICSLLLHPPNRELFLKAEGLQLMNLMLREKQKVSRNGALKVLDHALVGPHGRDSCAKFVDILGLRTIFPLFMKTPRRGRRKGVSAEEHEEHVVSIVASLMKNCRSGGHRQRLMAKFVENDYEKVERLMELHFKYLGRVSETERLMEEDRRNNEDFEDDEDAIYLKRLSGGLFTLQHVDYLVVDISSSAPAASVAIKQRVLQILNLHKASIKTIRNVVREYAGNVGEAGRKGPTDGQRQGSDQDKGAGEADESATVPVRSEEEDAASERERMYLLQLVDKF